MSQSTQSFIGVDLHKCTVTLTAVDPAGEKISRLKISTKSTGKIEDWLLDLPRASHMAVEACPFVEWFIDRFDPCVDRMDIANATELANLRGKRRKTDFNDSLDIAKRHARGECPLGYIADQELMQLRKLGRHWRLLSRLSSRSKLSMKSMLNAANIRGPKFDGASAQRWLLAHGDLLQPVQHDSFSDFVDILNLVERQRERLRRQIIFANRSEKFAPTISRLMTVPGIGEIWGAIIAAEIGPFDRFPNADALEFWAGLTADMKESAGRTQSGRITKAGSATLRWALGKAAVTLCQSDAGQEATRQRLITRIGKAKANVAMARRLLRILQAMMRDGKAYQRGPKRDRTAAANKARLGRKRQVA
jgi:transposase